MGACNIVSAGVDRDASIRSTASISSPISAAEYCVEVAKIRAEDTGEGNGRPVSAVDGGEVVSSHAAVAVTEPLPSSAPLVIGRRTLIRNPI